MQTKKVRRGNAKAERGVSDVERTLAVWKEYGEQFSDEQKASYIKGYQRAVQDVLRLANGGRESHLVRNWTMCDAVRAVAEAGVILGMESMLKRAKSCYGRCPHFDPYFDGECAATNLKAPSSQDVYSLEDGLPSFERIFNEAQIERKTRNEIEWNYGDQI